MVWAGVAYNLKTDLVFYRQGETVNADRYQSAILAPFVVPLCRQHNLVFQQDSAPCHTATRIAEFLRTENIDFWTKEDWPPNSPDLNPLDYGIWGMLEQEVHRKPPKNLQDLESKIQRAWENLDLSKVNRCIDRFKGRLRQCEDAKGSHFCYESKRFCYESKLYLSIYENTLFLNLSQFRSATLYMYI